MSDAMDDATLASSGLLLVTGMDDGHHASVASHRQTLPVSLALMSDGWEERIAS